MNPIAILGPGGVGGFLAAALSRAGNEVLLVAREPTVALIEGAGIAVESVLLGDFVAYPRAVARLDGPARVLIVATKATGLADALQRVGPEPDLVVPLLNGLDHMATLRARFRPSTVAAGVIRIESTRLAPGRIVQSSPFLRVDLASDRPEIGPALESLKEALEEAEVPALIGRSEAEILWSKLVRLTALACTTSAADAPIGVIRSDPAWRQALVGCIEEAAAVAHADGADIDPAAHLAELDDAHPGLRSSMQRDIEAGREPELDAIAGSVLRAGKRHGLDCPTIRRLAAQVAIRAGVAAPASAASAASAAPGTPAAPRD